MTMSPSGLSPDHGSGRAVTRRGLLGGGLAVGAAGLLGGCTGARGGGSVLGAFVSPDGAQVQAAEAARHGGQVRAFQLTAVAGPVDLGGLTVNTWSYDGLVPHTPLRVAAGEVVRATLTNKLPQETTVHWHGLALRNDADGVPGVTQPTVATGAQKTYQFTVTEPGTFWFHPHQGVQLDRGLYAPLIVEDPHEPLRYDDEWVVVLDDWLDGVTGTPDEVLAELHRGMGGMGGMGGASPASGGMNGMPGMGAASPTPATGVGGMPGMTNSTGGGHLLMGATSALLGGDAGDVKYPYYLINGRRSSAPSRYVGKPGRRLRIRIINAAGDTAFRVALGGHTMTVTHSDGFPVQPVTTDALLIGMGERYDVLVTLDRGVFPLVALAEGKNATALALVRTAAGTAPHAAVRPRQLSGRVLTHQKLAPTDAVRLTTRAVSRTVTFKLTGSMNRYDWAINNKPYSPQTIAPVRSGERVQVDFVNTTSMWHPMHLHGHTFAVGSATGPRKDTVVVLPHQTVSTVLDANNPGIWMVHCHNVYHAESGMMALLGYQK